MKKLVLMTAILVAGLQLFAQQKVVLVSNGISSIFSGDTPFIEAYNAAESGDTIYLPGAVLAAPAAIEKQLAIFGAGHYPDSTTATGETTISSNINLSEGADNTFLEGLKLTGSVVFNTNIKIDQVTISRCNFAQLVFNGTGSTPCESVTIKQCVINSDVYLNNASSCLLTNNIIAGIIYYGENNAIYNNLLLYNSYYGYTFNNVDNSDIANNIIVKNSNYVHGACDYNTFSNNTIGSNPAAGTNVFVNNFTNVNAEDLMVNQSGSVFDYSHDYHMIDPEAYLGIDGSQVGIYGWLYPYKDGAVPSNPHIVSKSIPAIADENGMLEVNITVNAQQD